MNPFPGMNPFLEDPAFWPDFHHEFISCWRERIADALPETYEARISERVRLVQLDPDVVKLIYPDVSVTRLDAAPARRSGHMATATVDPEIIPQEILDETRETQIEILHRTDRSLVAVLELLSPANKVGEGFRQYQLKRQALLREEIHLLEVDLLLQGERFSLLKPLPPGDYCAFLTRAEKRSACEVYSLSMRKPLPTLPIPLRAPDPDLLVDLQGVFDLTFQRGRYGRSLDYSRDLPWANSEQRRWIAERLGAVRN